MKIQLKQLKQWLFACLLLCSAFGQSQTGNPLWSIPPNSATFSPGPNLQPLPTNTTTTYGFRGTAGTSASPYNGYCAAGANNMRADADGKPLFFTAGSGVYNSNGYLIDEASIDATYNYPSGSVIGESEACLVPKPGSCSRYYLFTAMWNDTAWFERDMDTGRGGVLPYYMEIDMAQTGGAYMPAGELGKNVTTGLKPNTTVADLYRTTSTPVNAGYNNNRIDALNIFYAATRPRKGDGHRYLFMYNTAVLYVYNISSTGITYLRQYYTDGLTDASGNPVNFGSKLQSNNTELELYEDTINNKYKLAVGGYYSDVSGYLLLADFDTTATFITNTAKKVNASPATDPPVHLRGVEFSPNGQWVYFTHEKRSVNFPGTLSVVSYSNTATTYSLSTDSFQYSQVEKGTDGNLYVIKDLGSSRSLYKIANSNTPASASLSFAVSLGSYGQVYTGQFTDVSTYIPLPDQIDNENYAALFQANKTCCLFNGPYDKQVYYAGQTTTTWTNTATTQTWSPNTTFTLNPLAAAGNTTSTVTIGEELRIPAGYTITINNMYIKFSPQARLIIENGYSSKNGGKLTLNNCILDADNRCLTDMWPGVQVWGNPSNVHTNIYQGSLTMTGSAINNAYTSVLLGYDSTFVSPITPRPPYASLTNFSYAASGKTSGHGQGGGLLSVSTSTFTNNWMDVNIFPYSGTASNPNTIQTSVFQVTSALLNSSFSPRYGVGMYSHVNGAVVKNNSFTDTYNGNKDTAVVMNNSYLQFGGTSGTNTVTAMKFGVYDVNPSAGGATGAYLNATYNSFVDNYYGIYLGYVNYAKVQNNSFAIHNQSVKASTYYGLYLDNSTGYYVQDNSFTWATTGNGKLYGTIANNSGQNTNGICRNTYTNLYKGNQAQYINSTYGGSGIPNATGLLYLCNTFSNISAADIYVAAPTSTANVSGGSTCSTCTAGICYAQGDQNSDTGPNRRTADNQFSHTSGGKDFWIESGTNIYASTYIHYAAPGNCTVTTNAYKPLVYNNIGTPTCYTLSSAPNCTTGGLGHRSMYQNPLTEALARAAENKIVLDSLKLERANGDTSFNTSLKIGAALTDRQFSLDDAIHILLETDDTDSLNWAMRIMKEKSLDLTDRVQVETGIAIKDSAFAAAALNRVASEEGQSNYVKLHTLILTNLSKSPKLFLTANNIQMLQGFDKDSTDRLTYFKANLLLKEVGKSDYVPFIQEGTEDGSDDARKANANTSISQSQLSNHPNPFTDVTTIKASVVEKTANAYLLVTDVTGREIARYSMQTGDNSVEVNTANINYNVLFCTLVVDGVKVKTTKMLIMK